MEMFSDYINLICQVVTLASIIVKLTPSDVDNIMLDKVIKVLKVLSLNKNDDVDKQ